MALWGSNDNVAYLYNGAVGGTVSVDYDNLEVTGTGTTDDRPEPHCAFVELIRTENGNKRMVRIINKEKIKKEIIQKK